MAARALAGVRPNPTVAAVRHKLAAILEALPAGHYRALLNITRVRFSRKTGKETSAAMVRVLVADFAVPRRRLRGGRA